MEKRRVCGIDADLERLQPVALDQSLEGERVLVRRREAIEFVKRRRLALADEPEQNAVLHRDRVGGLPQVLAHPRGTRFGGRLQTLAIDVEQPAMKRATQAAVLESTEGQIGAAVRAVAVEHAVAA